MSVQFFVIFVIYHNNISFFSNFFLIKVLNSLDFYAKSYNNQPEFILENL